MIELRDVGLSGRDGGADAEPVASNVAIVEEGVAFDAGLEADGAAIAIMIWSVWSTILGCFQSYRQRQLAPTASAVIR